MASLKRNPASRTTRRAPNWSRLAAQTSLENTPGQPTNQVILGVDPGVNGVVAVLNPGGDLLQVCEKAAEESERHALHWLAVTERGT